MYIYEILYIYIYIYIERERERKGFPLIAQYPGSVYIGDIYLFINLSIFIFIEYGHEAKPSILGLQIIFLAAPRDDHDYGGDYRARQEL